MSGASTGPAGRLEADTWTKVYWAWGGFTVRFLLRTDAVLDVRWYGTVTAGIPIPRGPFRNGEEFSVPVVGYSDLWFRSDGQARYQLAPLDYKPLITVPVGR